MLAVASTDVSRARAVMDEHYDQGLDERARAHANATADFDAEETACPACGTRFRTAGAERCPDCGLAFR